MRLTKEEKIELGKGIINSETGIDLISGLLLSFFITVNNLLHGPPSSVVFSFLIFCIIFTLIIVDTTIGKIHERKARKIVKLKGGYQKGQEINLFGKIYEILFY